MSHPFGETDRVGCHRVWRFGITERAAVQLIRSYWRLIIAFELFVAPRDLRGSRNPGQQADLFGAGFRSDSGTQVLLRGSQGQPTHGGATCGAPVRWI